MKYVINNIQKINLTENDVLLFRYDDKYNLESIKNFAYAVKKQLTNKFLFVPISWDIKKITEDESV